MEYIHGAVWVLSVADKKKKREEIKHILYIGYTLTLFGGYHCNVWKANDILNVATRCVDWERRRWADVIIWCFVIMLGMRIWKHCIYRVVLCEVCMSESKWSELSSEELYLCTRSSQSESQNECRHKYRPKKNKTKKVIHFHLYSKTGPDIANILHFTFYPGTSNLACSRLSWEQPKVQRLAQGHFKMWTWGRGEKTERTTWILHEEFSFKPGSRHTQQTLIQGL